MEANYQMITVDQHQPTTNLFYSFFKHFKPQYFSKNPSIYIKILQIISWVGGNSAISKFDKQIEVGERSPRVIY